MSRTKRTHLPGARGQAFAEQVRGLTPDRILCVSIDVGKYFHVAMIHNALGEIATPPFEVDIFRHGFAQLCQAIDAARAQVKAQLVLVGMEPTGHYFENLAWHFLQHAQPVTLLNSYAVKQNRQQQMMQHEKTDEIDVAAIGDLLRRGEGSPYRQPRGVYLQLQHLDRVRLSKVKMQTMLTPALAGGARENQIVGHLDRIFPGVVLKGKVARERYTPLFASRFWECQTLQHLIRVCPDPHRLAAKAPRDLVRAFHAHEYALGPKTAAKIITYAQKVLWPNPELVALRCELLQHDLALLEDVERHLAQLEAREQALLAQTPYRIWAQLKGFASTHVVSLAAAIGDPANYSYAGQVFLRSGLVSSRNDSGVRQREGKGKRVTKQGDVYLRRALLNALGTLVPHQPVLRQYAQKLKQSKPAAVARVATGRRALGILWATQRDQRADTLLFKKGTGM